LLFILFLFVYKWSGFVIPSIIIFLGLLAQGILAIFSNPFVYPLELENSTENLLISGYMINRLISVFIPLLMLMTTQSMFKNAGLFLFGVILAIVDGMRSMFSLNFFRWFNFYVDLWGKEEKNGLKFGVIVLVAPALIGFLFARLIHRRLRKVNDKMDNEYGNLF